MANFKRGKSRCRVGCTLCTSFRWMGNNRNRFKARDEVAKRNSLRRQD